TILAMENVYEGPPEKFAMVIPVPVVLQKDNVKTLLKQLFERVDRAGAPRLVEYWEQDPCAESPDFSGLGPSGAGEGGGGPSPTASGNTKGVKVEANFIVGEYDVVILSAKDSTGLEAWLRENKYAIPDGAEKYLRPYVEQGSK